MNIVLNPVLKLDFNAFLYVYGFVWFIECGEYKVFD